MVLAKTEHQAELDKQIAQAEEGTGRQLTQQEIDKIYADVQKMLIDTKDQIFNWGGEVLRCW